MNAEERKLMESCPRYERCSAPICPADPAWRQRRHVQGERVCFWLTELVKTDGQARLSTTLTEPLLAAVVQARDEIGRPASAHGEPDGIGAVRRAMEKASASGSRIAAAQAAGRRLRQAE